jgi:hypothetical protein
MLEVVRIPADPDAYAKFEAAVLSVVPGRRHDPNQTPAQRRIQNRIWAEHDARRRWTNTVLLFWKVCGHAACARAKSCVGNQHDCLMAIWPHVDPEFKAWLRGFVPARANGASKEEALKQAEASIADYRSCAEFDARIKAGCKRPAAEPVAVLDAPPCERATARVRTL